MIKRTLQPVLEKTAEIFPSVTIIGPRQSGKTTLAKTTFSQHAYANLEDPELRMLAKGDPNEFLKQYAAPVIIDEIQRVPELLSAIQVRIDEEPEAKGRFILTGSHQLDLRASISQSLAGRTALLKLLPLSLAECQTLTPSYDRDDYLLNGFMPRHYQEHVPPDLLYRNYYETYVERDIRQLINLKSLQPFQLFVKLLAGRIGQLVNLHSLSGEVGVSSATLKEWLAALEASFIVFRLPPYYENFGKRYIKSPKLYFAEVGLAAYLLEIRRPEQVARDPLLGNLFENMVVIEALKQKYHTGQDADLYFFRDQRGLEIDLIQSEHRQLTPIEIKAARTFDPDFTRNLHAFRKLDQRIHAGAVIYAGKQEHDYQGTRLLNFKKTSTLISQTHAG